MAKQSQSSGETSTTALVFLVLFTAFVLITALGGDESTDSTLAQPADNQATASADTDMESADIGTTSADAIGNSIPVDEDAVVENRMVSRGDGEAMEQVISFESDLSADHLSRQYESWIANNGYTLEKQRQGKRAASLAATSDSQALIVLISYLSNSDRSYVEIINYPRS